VDSNVKGNPKAKFAFHGIRDNVFVTLHCFHNKALFRSHPKSKIFQDFSSHQILWRMHGALNVGKKKLIAQFTRNWRDESFKPK